MSCAFLHSYGAVCDACAGCQSACAVHRPNGTRARNVPSRIAPAPLRNHQIAFGCGRFPVRRISHRCVPRGPLRALRFACALDCFAICAAPLRKLRFLRRIAGAVGRAVGTGARALPCGGHSAPACPCVVRYAPHPPMGGIRLGRNTSRRRSAAPVRRCAHPAARARSGPVPAARPLAR